MIIINSKNGFEMPADVANAIKSLNPDVKAKIEEVFQAYNDSEQIKLSISRLETFFNTYRNVRGKYFVVNELNKKLDSICNENHITIEKSNEYSVYNIKLDNLINIKINTTKEQPYSVDFLSDFSVTYI